jgi:dTDP-4-dehydrorhamnose 3,5-epimerase
MPNRSTGLRYNDPKIGIDWPLPVSSIAEKDRQWAVR